MNTDRFKVNTTELATVNSQLTKPDRREGVIELHRLRIELRESREEVARLRDENSRYREEVLFRNQRHEMGGGLSS